MKALDKQYHIHSGIRTDKPQNVAYDQGLQFVTHPATCRHVN